MSAKMITDKDVVYQIAQILVREIAKFQYPKDQSIENAIGQMIDAGAAPLMTYSAMATELNAIFARTDSARKFNAANIDQFMGMLLKESINYSYKVDGISHRGIIRKKIGQDVPITAIVVNTKTHLPNKQFFNYFPLPHTTPEEMRATTIKLLTDLFTYYYWPDYLKRVDKVFGRK